MIWSVGEEQRLSGSARAALGDGSNSVVVSAASIWEIAIKRATGKLRPPVDDLIGSLRERGVALLSITVEHAWAAGALPLHHRDPFDRVLVAQAQLEGLTIVTRDSEIAKYQVAILPA